MAKTLKGILEVYSPKSKDEKRFKDKHIIAKQKLDDAGTQDDKMFNATNIKTISREKTRHGYDVNKDERVYEESTKLHPMALHVSHVDSGMHKGKYKVHAVGKSLADSIDVGEHLSDTELDDASEMGAKIKHKDAYSSVKEESIAEGVEDRHADAYDDFNRHIKKVANKDTRDSLKKNFSRAMRGFSRHYERDDGAEGMYDHVERMEGLAKEAERHASIKEEVEGLDESDTSHQRFQKNHEEAAKHIKGITKALSDHYDAVTSKKNYNQGEAGWHHVDQIKTINNSLSDLHDRILQMADYSKPVKLKEGYDQDPELNELLNTVYENLSDDNKEIFNDILENSPDQMIEFLEQLEVQNG